jgi:hypothetical protein
MRRVLATTLTIIAIAACAQAPPSTGSVSGRLVAGPTCPVETDPPDPACAAAPVAGAVVTAIAPGGDELTTESDDEGKFMLEVPSGEVVLHFGDIEGLMGSPDDMTVRVVEDQNIDLGAIAYDTGIR